MASRLSKHAGVSIIVCTNRPQFFHRILVNYMAQRHRVKELIIILNKDSMSLAAYRRKALSYPNVAVYKVPGRISLGQCLNCGIARAKYPLIAKFDDDDYYSPYYLTEQVSALARMRSDIVGKHACLVYLAASKRLVIRSPQEQHKFVSFVQGGTILFRRRILSAARFSDRSLGEDVKFQRDCGRRGYRIYATSPYNYVYIRRKSKKNHTWKARDSYYSAGSLPVAVTRHYRAHAIRPPASHR